MDQEIKNYIDEAVKKFREESDIRDAKSRKEADERMAQLNKSSDERAAMATKDSDERIERYMGVAFEQMDHKMEAIRENTEPLVHLPSQVNQLQEKVDTMSDTLDAVFEAVGEHEQILQAR